MFKPHDWLDRVFEIGIIGKGLNGAVELFGGLLLLFVTPDWIRRLAVSLTRVELSEDPHDFIATHLLHSANGITGGAVLFGALYLLSHGAVKIFLVVSLLRNKLWAYPLTIVVLSMFVVYQLYRISLHVSFAMVALTVFDLLIIALTVREYKEQRATRRNPPDAAGVKDGESTGTAGRGQPAPPDSAADAPQQMAPDPGTRPPGGARTQ